MIAAAPCGPDASTPNIWPISRGGAPLVASPRHVPGDRVHILARSRPVIEARLASFDSAFGMPDPLRREMTTFDNAMELHGPKGESLLAPGDAGALVMDERGDWLGIIIAGKGHIAFAAPLAPWVGSMELVVPTNADIRRHNKIVDRIAQAAQDRLARAQQRRVEIELRIRQIKPQRLQGVTRTELEESHTRAEELFA